MRLRYLAVFAVLASVMGIAGSWFQLTYLQPQPVKATPPRSMDGAVRIAVVNLEEVARQSWKFKELKLDWERSQTEIRAQNQRWRDAYDVKKKEIQRALLTNEGDETMLMLRVELQAIEEAMKAAETEQKQYLSALLDQYQKDVLVIVMNVLEEYVRVNGYDIVFQDYTAKTSDADFFGGGVFSQTLLSKPVLYAPGLLNNKNAYVTDLTDVIGDRAKLRGAGEKRKDKDD